MRIGILTYHRSHNYGAYLQAYALTKKIKEETNYEVELIDYNSTKSKSYYIKDIFRYKNLNSIIYNFRKYLMFKKEIKKLPTSHFKMITDDIKVFKEKIDGYYNIIIVGSDEIWKIGGFRGFPNIYWLPTVNNVIKMSYAASSRNVEKDLSKDIKNKISLYLSDFSFISLRDDVSKSMIENITNRKCYRVCDPTFAYDFKFDKKRGKELLCKKFKINPNKKVIGIMVSHKELANKIISKYGSKYQIISLFYYYKGSNSNPTITPFEWLQVIGSVNFFITSFFHGMCFALKSDTPFLIIESRNLKNHKYSKSFDLLSRYNLLNHFILNNKGQKIDEKIENFVNEYIKEDKKVDYSNLRNHEKKTFEIFLKELKNIKNGDFNE